MKQSLEKLNTKHFKIPCNLLLPKKFSDRVKIQKKTLQVEEGMEEEQLDRFQGEQTKLEKQNDEEKRIVNHELKQNSYGKRKEVNLISEHNDYDLMMFQK